MIVLSLLIVTVPLVPVVFTDFRVTTSPSGSLALARTLMSIAVFLSVDALTLPAVGGYGHRNFRGYSRTC